MGINSHWVSHGVMAFLSVYSCTFTYLRVKTVFFKQVCVCVCVCKHVCWCRCFWAGRQNSLSSLGACDKRFSEPDVRLRVTAPDYIYQSSPEHNTHAKWYTEIWQIWNKVSFLNQLTLTLHLFFFFLYACQRLSAQSCLVLHLCFSPSADSLVDLEACASWLLTALSAQQHILDWRAWGQRSCVSEEEINLQ